MIFWGGLKTLTGNNWGSVFRPPHNIIKGNGVVFENFTININFFRGEIVKFSNITPLPLMILLGGSKNVNWQQLGASKN